MAELPSESSPAAGDPRRLICGELKLAAGDATFELIHPGTGEVAGQVFGAMGARPCSSPPTNLAMSRRQVAGRRGLLLEVTTT